MKQFTIFNQLTAMPKRLAMALTVLFTLGVGSMWGATETISSFSVTSGTSGDVSYTAYKGGGTSSPAVNSSAIRLYQNASGTTGGYIVISVPEGYKITSATIKSTMATTTGYYIASNPGNTTPAKANFVVNNKSLNANTEYTVSGLSTQHITFACFGTSSSSRLYLSYLSVTYESPAAQTYTVTLIRNGNEESVNDVESGTALDDIDGTGDQGGCADWTFVGWSKSERTAQDNSTTMDLVTEVDGAGPYYAVYSHTVEGGGGSTTATMSSFSAVSGNVNNDANVRYEAAKGSAGTAPAVNNEEIRIYQNGGTLTITGNNGKKLTSITIGSSMKTSVSYKIDGGSESTTQSITASGKYTLSDINATSVLFTCKGTDKNSRLYLNHLSVTYSGGQTVYYTTNPQCADPCASLAAPTVTATNITSNSFTLSWNAVDGATSYNVYNYTSEDMDETTSTSYTFSGLDADTPYEWAIEAAKGNCYKSTNGTTTTSVALTPLNAPSNLRETITCAGVSLAWDAVSGASKYEYTLNGTSTQINKSSTSVYISPVTAGKTYTWTVKAIGDGMTYSDSPDAAVRTFTSYYSVTYNLNGGSWNPGCENSCAVGGTFEICSTEPSKDGYNFVGWSTADDTEAEYQAGGTINNVSANTTLYAVWEAIPTYTVTFDSDGGSDVASQTIEEGTRATKPADPTKEGYDFVGWYNGNTEFEFDEVITGDITLTAEWNIITYNIEYTGLEGVTHSNPATYTIETATITFTAPSNRDGYVFKGWTPASIAKGSTGDKTVTATWAKVYTITWKVNGEEYTEGTPTTSVEDGNAITHLPTAPSAPSGCSEKVFVGWTNLPIPTETNETPTLYTELKDIPAITANTTLYAVWADKDVVEGKPVEETASVNISAYATANSWSNSTQYLTVNIDENITATASGKENTGKYYTSGTNWRLYVSESATLTVTSKNDCKIQTVTITYTSDNNGTLKNGESNVTSNTEVTVNAESIKFNTSGSSDKGQGQVRITAISVTYTTATKGDDIITYSNYSTTCVKLPDPVWEGATIDKTFFTVNCGECSPMTGANGAAKITFSTEKIKNFTSAITIEATTGFLVSTSQTEDANYKSSVSLSPLVGTTNANTFYNKFVYVRAEAPAQSDTDLEGTITIKNSEGDILQTFYVTADVTCTGYTLTLIDRGVSTLQPETYFAGQTIDEAPAAPEGVCTDPIHYVFDGWTETTVTNGSTGYTPVSFPYKVTGNTKFYAVYRYVEEGSGDSGDYVKVTENLDDYSGDYLIVYETGNVAFNGGLDDLDVASNTISVTINSNTIESNATTDAAKFTMAKVDGGYSIKSTSGYYIGWSTADKNGLNANSKYSANYYLNTISNSIISGVKGTLKYNKTSGQERFRYYQSAQESIALYRKAASYLYTTSPVCGPHLAITSDKDIYITGGNAGGTHDLVVAQQKVAYQATRLEKDKSTGNLPSIKVLPSNISYDADKTKAVTITFDEDSVRTLQSDGTYTISGTMTISYQPKANNVTDDIRVVLNANYNPSADVSQASFTVHARSLPEEFVIVAKSGDKWYALNGDMSNGSSANPANGQVVLDDDTEPTKATYAPCNTIYTFDGLPNTGDRKYVRFQGTDGAWLWAASGTNVGIQNKSLATTPAGDNAPYNWEIETTDNITYFFHNANSSRVLRLNDGKFGMYVSGTDVIRILPYEAKCLYNYAPTNLKVSVLKGSYVTLTWDAVAGATKYQYRTDDNTWTDTGTEPTVTISGLSKGTDYTYYVRAYHADAGVSQECFDYSKVSFTTADCDDVPTDITYTADLNSITVSWTASAATATIKLYSDEAGEHAFFTQSGATSPKKISSLQKNTTYYLQIFSNGTCASQIIPVKTEDVKVDVVEWKTDGIIVDINTNDTVSVSLENEVSYGSGAGAEATELFFSKYYEATTNVKLVAIYNGTKNIIDLTDYEIHYGKTPEKGWETNYITLKDFGATKGQIQPGEELILYTMSGSDNSDKQIMDCVNAKYPDGKWVRVTQTNNTGKGSLSFAGDKTIVLKKEGTIIDIIGAINSNGLPNNAAVTRPSWGDANGWTCATGLSIADDTEIGISTNRCLLIRNNTVTSGENAVTSNIDDFVTLCSEWKGAQVPDTAADNGVAASCENFAYVGTFDYSDYYTKYESMGEGTTFYENDRHPDGTVTIPITDLYKQSCRNIRIILKDKGGNVISNQEYKVPIMITTTQGTDGEAFIALQENLAMIKTDPNGNPTGDKTNLTLEQAKEICKTCDVVVRDNATLTKMADDAANDHPQVRDVYVYENSSLIVPNGTNYTINNLSLRRKEDAVASVNAYPEALKLPESAAAPISLDFRLSAESWHWFTLPYDCNISEVKWVDGSPAQYNVDWFLMTYDGEKRAATQTGGNWKAYTGTTIKAGEGFILAINGNINNPKHTYELRFPMAKDVLVAEGTDKTVDVHAWGVENDIRPNHKGWNLVGNPYLAYYQRDNINSFKGLRLGELVGPDPQTGYWTQTGNVPYVVVPIGAGYKAYEQLLASGTDLLPFTAYFVQVGNDGTHNSKQDLKVSFDHTKLQLSATPMPASIVHRAPSEVNETEEPVIVGVALTNSLGESDKTSLVIADRFSNEYEMQADFFKWFGDYYKYYTKPVLYTIGADQGKRAFNALNEQLATQPIPMGLFAAKAGDYTFALNRRSDLSKVEEVWLHDANTNTYTNLMQNDYNFYTTKTDGGGRFTISVKLAPKVATGMENVNADKVWATTQNQQIIVNGLENNTQLWMYDAAGKLLYTEVTSNYQHRYSVPQVGTYFIALQKGTTKQTIKVVVE